MTSEINVHVDLIADIACHIVVVVATESEKTTSSKS